MCQSGHAINALPKWPLLASAQQGALSEVTLENGDGGTGAKMKRPGRPSAVRRFIKLGLSAPAHEVSLTMEDFRDNIERKVSDVTPQDPDASPLQWAVHKVCRRLLPVVE